MGDHHHRVRIRYYERMELLSNIFVVARVTPFSESPTSPRFRRYIHHDQCLVCSPVKAAATDYCF